MRWFARLEQRFGSYAIPHLTLALVAGQVAVFLLSWGNPGILANVGLVGALVLKGEFWRVVTFLFAPPMSHPIFLFFYWYLFALMGTALEAHWGLFRYNVFLLVGYLATLAVSFILPHAGASNTFLQASVFLAFAFVFPEFVLHLFFVFPVKIKWLAAITWLFYLYVIATGDWMARLLVLASIGNVLAFFGRDIWLRIRQGHRRMRRQTGAVERQETPRHRCLVCGITNLSHPKMAFRYCSQCTGQCGYCSDHIRDHQHVTEDCQASGTR